MAISNNNVQNIQFLRNQSIAASRAAALTAIESGKQFAADGTLLLARYEATENNATVIKTIAGLVAVSGNTKYLTIIDVEGAGADVEALRQEINAKLGEGITSENTATSQLSALSGTSVDGSGVTSVWGAKAYADDLISNLDGGVTAGTGSYVLSVSEVDGKVSGTTAELPTVAVISESGKAIIAVSEDKGTIAASAGTINAEYVNIADSGEKFTATTVEGALAELDGKITDAIDALDYTGVTTGTGVYVTNVTEENGVVSATTATLPSVTGQSEAKKVVIAVSEDKGTVSDAKGTISSSAETIVLTDNEDGGINFEVHFDGTTIIQDPTTKELKVASSALVQYAGDEDTIHISDVVGDTKTVSSYLTIQKVTTGLSEEVKEEYHLVGHSGNTIGDPVKIYKDSHIVSISYQSDPEQAHYQNLIYTYLDVSGNTQTEYVDISELVLEAEFASGVTVTNHVAHGVVDPTSESYLTVGTDGFKLSGVNAAITAAVEALDADKSGSTTHVSVRVVEEDGKITAVTVAEDDIASAQGLADEITARTDADTELSNRLGTGVTTANTATAQLIALSGDSSTDTSATTSVEGAKRYADAKLSEAVAGLDADVSGNSTHVTVGVKEVDGVITVVSVAEDNIANADDLVELSGQTVSGIVSTNGSISASINDAVGNKQYDIETDASKIKMSGFTATTTGSEFSAITTDKSVAEAANIIVKEIIDNEETVAEALNDLDGRLDNIESGFVETVKVNNVALTEANNTVNVQISSNTSAVTATGNEAIVVTTDQSTGEITLGLATIDCGTY